jgi:2-iminobutanoate/2-iminopropanoate deaminase
MTSNTIKKIIDTPHAPKAVGPYSQAIRAGNLLFLSGQLAIDPVTNQFLSSAGIEEQTARILENIKAVLAAEGMSLDQVVSTTVYMKDIKDFQQMNKVYATYFAKKSPARATVQVNCLPLDALIEISAIAVK